jgi:hypothetical protein
MGDLLQIRVSASTFRPEDVESRYPKLVELAAEYADADAEANGLGVLELVNALQNTLHMGDVGPDLRDALKENVAAAFYLKTQLEAALADRKPQEADSFSYSIEETLDKLEKSVADKGGD